MACQWSHVTVPDAWAVRQSEVKPIEESGVDSVAWQLFLTFWFYVLVVRDDLK